MSSIGYDKAEFSRHLAMSFVSDPFFSFLSSEIKVLNKIIGVFVDMAIQSDSGKAIVILTSDDIEGGAIWLDLREEGNKSIWNKLAFYVRIFFSGCFSKILSIRSPLMLMLKQHKHLYEKSDYYLSFLFVRLEYRGKGMASDLLNPMIERFDKENLTCSVDTFNQNNVEIYRSYGFELVNTSNITDSIRNYQMTRIPQSVV